MIMKIPPIMRSVTSRIFAINNSALMVALSHYTRTAVESLASLSRYCTGTR